MLQLKEKLGIQMKQYGLKKKATDKHRFTVPEGVLKGSEGTEEVETTDICNRACVITLNVRGDG